MKLKFIFLALIVAGAVVQTQAEQSPAQLRKKAEALAKDGNWKEALDISRAMLESVDDRNSGKDLLSSLRYLRELRQVAGADEILENAVRRHSENWILLRQAAQSYQQLQHSGFLLDGEFRRGYHRGGGAYVSCGGRDRVRSIQLILQALGCIEENDKRVASDLYSDLAGYLALGRTGPQRVWALGVLTNLADLPDYGDEGRLSSGSGAPVDADGSPLVLDVPESWEGAENDGERWRWALSESVRLGPEKESKSKEQWARFLVQHYGVGTLTGFGRWMQQDPEEAEGILQVHTLKETETLANLASGVRRFDLVADYQFIPLLRRLSTGKQSNAALGDLLVQVFLNRRQYAAGAQELKRIISTHGKGKGSHRENLLEQVEGEWGRFEVAPMTQAGKKPKLSFIYRNAKDVQLSLHALDIDLVVDDLFKHLEGNPREINSSVLDVARIGSRLVNENQKKYLGAKIDEWEVALEPRENHWDTRAELIMPVSEAGAYLLKATPGKGNASWIVVWIADTALVSQVLKDGNLFYLAESKAGSPLSGSLELFGFRVERREGVKAVLRKFDVKTKRIKKKIGAQGSVVLAKGELDPNYQWMAVGRSLKGGRALMGFQSHRWNDFRWGKLNNSRSYGITDRPVYRPEQKVYVKFWSRTARHDLDDVSLFANKKCTIEIHHEATGKVEELKNLRTDEYGGVEGEWMLPLDARLGVYQVYLKGEVPGGSIHFRVEEYKKPEFEVVVEAPDEPIRLGETIEAKVRATYYHGAPVTDGRVKVKVQRFSHSDTWFPGGAWDWLYGEGYWWFGQDYPEYPGWRKWGCVAPVPPWWGGQRWTPPELVLDREFEIEPDGKVSVLIDTSVAKLVHGDIDHRYTVSAEVVDSSRRTIEGSGSVLVARKPFSAKVWLDQGYARPGVAVNASFSAHTLDGRAVSVKGVGVLYRVTLDDNGKVKESQIKSFKVEGRDLEKGEGEIRFKAPSPGQYRFSVKLTDEKGNEEEGATVFVVRNLDDDGSKSRFNPLELILDKKEYLPGEEARVLVNTKQKNSTVLLFVRTTGGSAEEMRPIQIRGKSKEVVLKLLQKDMPNIHIQAVTLVNGKVVSETRQIVLPPQKRLLSVEVLPGKDRVKPGEKSALRIRLKDQNGDPFEGATVVTIYDKSLEAIAGGSNVQNLRDFFWSWTRPFYRAEVRHSQSFQGSQIGKTKAPRMQTLGRFGNLVSELSDANSVLRREAYSFGEGLMRSRGAPNIAAMEDSSTMLLSNGRVPAEGGPAMKSGAAGGQGGAEAPQVMVRSGFADLVKWAGAIKTNKDGEAEIEVEYPDNLTTWKVKVWALGKGTRVGEGSAEVITSKDLIVRLQAPRFFVETDEVVLSAVVHNYREDAKEVEVTLELEGGALEAIGSTGANVVIPGGGEQRVDWRAVARKEGDVMIRMKAVAHGGDRVLDADDESDAMEMEFPVYVHGILRTESWSRASQREKDSVSLEFEVPKDRRPGQSRLEIRYSPTVAGAMVDSLPYLAAYPHSSTEHTVNRFVPAVITQRLLRDMQIDLAEVRNKRANLNPQELGDAQKRASQWRVWKDNPVWNLEEVDTMVRKGVKRLREMQNSDGGWGWFSAYGARSYPHTTAVVVHGLTVARANGAPVPDELLNGGVEWLKRYEQGQVEMVRSWKMRKKKTKQRADALDSLVRKVLGMAGIDEKEMLGFLKRDRVKLPVYAKCLLGLELHRTGDLKERDGVIRNIEQFLKEDRENQTAWLDLGAGGYWWRWYGSEFEAHAFYLKLLAVAKPRSSQASGLAKYLVNNRKHATSWKSTRDTAYCVEALADYLRASGEDSPEMEVEVLLDGKSVKTVKISKENLFSYDGVVMVAGDVLGTGKHKIELRRAGKGPLYVNVYLTVFSREKFLKKAGLEVKLDRAYYKLVPVMAVEDVSGSRGQALRQRREKYERRKIEQGEELISGDLIEVELSIESKNDYSYLVFEDWKAAGFEAVELRSGHGGGGLSSFVEYRDEKVSMYVRSLPRGRHSLSYRLRAETPGTFSALPARAEAMYAPELKGNSDEMKVSVGERKR
ncbi:MAG: alpha-2-macroglobulin family protein [Roseibacillus sp.]|nr:alpha-2-macroglobulin family protein [Roseibacillus sp.]